MSLLLDTCAAIWLLDDAAFSDEAVQALDLASDIGEPVYVSPITGWEIGLLAARGRSIITMPPQVWFDRLLAVPGVHLTDLSPRILIAASFLPGSPPRDPADRIILATAREGGYRLVTRDKNLLAYAEQGYISALAC